MRLLNTTSLKLEEHYDPPSPYAILSHTWGPDQDEVTFQDLNSNPDMASKKGYRKIIYLCDQARQDELSYAWIDTCCIDKTNSTELSEAINSMWSWYSNAKVCYVYMPDVEFSKDENADAARDSAFTLPPNVETQFRQSRWFTRGWTLQEMIAPPTIVFYSRDWTEIGFLDDGGRSGFFPRVSFVELISEASGITHSVMVSGRGKRYMLDRFSVAQRMSWAATRHTKRKEDLAYCLLGLFDVHMPLLYGEGDNAFLRLQEEIIKKSTDHSIFTWSRNSSYEQLLIAPFPCRFVDCGNVETFGHLYDVEPFEMNSVGVQIKLPIFMLPIGESGRLWRTYALLKCHRQGQLLALELKPSAAEWIDCKDAWSLDIQNFKPGHSLVQRIRKGSPRLKPEAWLRYKWIPLRLKMVGVDCAKSASMEQLTLLRRRLPPVFSKFNYRRPRLWLRYRLPPEHQDSEWRLPTELLPALAWERSAPHPQHDHRLGTMTVGMYSPTGYDSIYAGAVAISNDSGSSHQSKVVVYFEYRSGTHTQDVVDLSLWSWGPSDRINSHTFWERCREDSRITGWTQKHPNRSSASLQLVDGCQLIADTYHEGMLDNNDIALRLTLRPNKASYIADIAGSSANRQGEATDASERSLAVSEAGFIPARPLPHVMHSESWKRAQGTEYF